MEELILLEAENFSCALAAVGARKVEDFPLLIDQPKTNSRVSDGELNDDLSDVARLGVDLTQKFPPCRCIEEEVAHLDRRSRSSGRRGHVAAHATFNADRRTLCISGTACFNVHSRYGTDTGQCFAAKTQGCDTEQVAGRVQLARRMALDADCGILARHSDAVV